MKEAAGEEKRNAIERGHSMREYQQLLSSLMGGGANVRINIHRTLNLVQL